MIAVLTTIQEPTESVAQLVDHLEAHDIELIVIGDRKGPAAYRTSNTTFLSLEDQMQSQFRLAKALPTGHYARKNVGYLAAVSKGATCIYETDDDNAPNQFWRPRFAQTKALRINGRRWANVYRMFSDDKIWPRGFPLELVSDPNTYELQEDGESIAAECPIQQGLADISPDVDAIWRLTMDREFRFERRASVWLTPGTWCPFNSQTTWWWPQAYPLLYLPSYCSFRMTDIWRSFVAQRCLWEMGHGVVFHAPEVEQVRNFHNLIQDFEQEVPGYTLNSKIVNTLEALSLRRGAGTAAENLVTCYEALVRIGVMPAKELNLLNCWREDLASVERDVLARPAFA